MDKTVFIKSDARARYGVVEDVVDNVRAAGVDQIGLITELIPVKSERNPDQRRRDSKKQFFGYSVLGPGTEDWP